MVRTVANVPRGPEENLSSAVVRGRSLCMSIVPGLICCQVRPCPADSLSPAFVLFQAEGCLCLYLF